MPGNNKNFRLRPNLQGWQYSHPRTERITVAELMERFMAFRNPKNVDHYLKHRILSPLAIAWLTL